MRLNILVLKAFDVLENLAATGLAAHAIYNISQENYTAAALEAIASVGLLAGDYLDRRDRNRHLDLAERFRSLDYRKERSD